MYPNGKQSGFAIISALFLIVVLAFLGVSMSRIFSSGQQAINQDITSFQAYLSGQSALQWGMYQAVAASPTGEHILTFSDEGLNNTKARVILTKTTILGKDYYRITTQASYSNTGNPEFSMRNLEVRFVP